MLYGFIFQGGQGRNGPIPHTNYLRRREGGGEGGEGGGGRGEGGGGRGSSVREGGGEVGLEREVER